MQPVEHPQEPDGPEAGPPVDPRIVAERRARRAELSEAALRKRVVDAELQLVEAQRLLGGAHDQRKELAARLKQAERDLRAARQGEYAEAQRRTELEEDAGAVRWQAEQEIAHLRAALGVSDERVSELEAELDRVSRTAAELHHAVAAAQAQAQAQAQAHGPVGPSDHEAALDDACDAVASELAARLEEVRLVEGRLAAGRAELASRRGGLELRLHDTEVVAGGLEQQLVLEREHRMRAVRELQDERERAGAEVTLLQHELDRRLKVQETVSAQLAQLRAELAQTQTRVASDADRRAVADSVLKELGSTALELRDELQALEDERRELERQLAAVRRQVAERDTHLTEQAQALAAADAALDVLRTELDGERRDHARIEAELQSRLAAERDAFRDTVEQHRLVTEAAIASERAAFEAQVATVRDGVAALRGRLGGVEAEVEARVQRERDARLVAEQRASTAEQKRDRLLEEILVVRDELGAAQADARAAVAQAHASVVEAQDTADAAIQAARTHVAQSTAEATTRAERAEAERDRLRVEIDAQEPGDDVQASLARLRSELSHVRAETAARAGREVQLESLVSQLISSASSLKEGFARELEATASERDLQLIAERERFDAQLVDMEDRVTEMRAQLAAAGAELSSQLTAERTARWAAEEQLRQMRELASSVATEAVDTAEVARLHGLLTLEQEAAARAEERIVELEDELERVRVALRPPPPMPPADHPALRDVPPVTASGSGDPDSVIIDLARASARLRLRREEALAEAAPVASDEAGAAPGAEPVLDGQGAPAAPEASVAVAAHPEVEIGRRSEVADPRRAASWLTPALAGLAGRDPGAAAAMLQSLIPLQASRLQQDLTYDLQIEDQPALRVRLHHDGTSTVAPHTPEQHDDSADFRIAGPAIALAPLFGGGAGRRLPAGVILTGRRRRGRRLLRALRRPVTLTAVATAQLGLSSFDLLTLVMGAIDPAATASEHFSVAFADADGPVTSHVVVADTLPLDVRAGVPEDAAATVRTAPGVLAAFLAGDASARVTGDVSVVGRLLAWADAAQGLDA